MRRRVAGARPDSEGVPLTRWSLPRLALQLGGEGIEVSPRHLGTLLAEAGLSFQRTRSWKAMGRAGLEPAPRGSKGRPDELRSDARTPVRAAVHALAVLCGNKCVLRDRGAAGGQLALWGAKTRVRLPQRRKVSIAAKTN
jgi:hypothetical protein